MNAFSTTAYAIDHLVLPVSGLDTARRRLSSLGFTVAPDGVHPFGTANCCVFLADGTYLEPLAVVDAAGAQAAIAAGNVFVERDRRYRAQLGDDGFSAIVLATHDAGADHRRFIETDMSAGGMLEFSRTFVDPSGRSQVASFRLAFAAERDTSESFCFACERIGAVKVDRSALERHQNGVGAMLGVVAVSRHGERSEAFLRSVSGAGPGATTGQTRRLMLTNAWVEIAAPVDFQDVFGVDPGPVAATRLAAIVFAAYDVDAVEALLRANGVACLRRPGRLVVPPAPGQGATFIFEATP